MMAPLYASTDSRCGTGQPVIGATPPTERRQFRARRRQGFIRTAAGRCGAALIESMTTTLVDVLPSIGYAAPPRFHPAVWPLTAHADEEGRLCIGEVALTDVADEFRTPTYVLDEADFRARARRYRHALRGAEVVYAGKSPLTIAVARWARDEGLSVDVCSAGELATALAAGVKPVRIIMHGNAKSDDELRSAVRVGVGRIVVDSCIEIAYLAGLASQRQRVLIRVTPDIDIHGHRAVTTGVSDQKFGFTLDAGRAAEAVARVLAHPNLDLIGLHCHIGSQVADAGLYGEAIRRMIAAMADIRARHGVILTELNIGGGHAIPYLPGDPELDLDELARVVDDALDAACAAEHFPRPVIVVEPGRAISARAGVTLYEVQACIPAICWPWPAPARTTTAWRRTTTWSAGRRWWRSKTAEPLNWSAAKRSPICWPATGVDLLVEQVRVGLQVGQAVPAQVDQVRGNHFLLGLPGVQPPLGGHRHRADQRLGVERRRLRVETALGEVTGQNRADLVDRVVEQGRIRAGADRRRRVADQDPEAVGALLDVGEQCQRHAFDTQPGPVVGRLGQRRRDAVQQRRHLPVDDDGVQPLLAAEMLVHDWLGDIGAQRDLLDRGALVAALGKQ